MQLKKSRMQTMARSYKEDLFYIYHWQDRKIYELGSDKLDGDADYLYKDEQGNTHWTGSAVPVRKDWGSLHLNQTVSFAEALPNFLYLFLTDQGLQEYLEEQVGRSLRDLEGVGEDPRFYLQDLLFKLDKEGFFDEVETSDVKNTWMCAFADEENLEQNMVVYSTGKSNRGRLSLSGSFFLDTNVCLPLTQKAQKYGGKTIKDLRVLKSLVNYELIDKVLGSD